MHKSRDGGYLYDDLYREKRGYAFFDREAEYDYCWKVGGGQLACHARHSRGGADSRNTKAENDIEIVAEMTANEMEVTEAAFEEAVDEEVAEVL